MKRRLLTVGGLVCGICAMSAPARAIFTSVQISTFTASATISGIPLTSLTFQVAALPNPAFFGKDVVIPVQVTANSGSIDLSGVAVTMWYQLIGLDGVTPLAAPASVPVALTPGGTSGTLNGTAVIPLEALLPIQNGGQIYYVFVAKQGGAGVIFGAGAPAPAPGSFTTLVSAGSFLTAITNTTSPCQLRGPEGGPVFAPDLFEGDGHTGVIFPAGALTATGRVCIKQEKLDGWPGGPGGSQPIVIYTITLEGTSLSQTAQLRLSYAADDKGHVVTVQDNGQIKDLNVDAGDLAIFWLGPENLPLSDQAWRVLSQPTVDKTQHTVTATTSHFSTFALFVPGASTAGSAAGRPATRIITPNGDGINDTLIFASDVDEVRIFDVRGRKIRTIPGPGPVWDGKDDSGKVVETGVYIYQYTHQSDRVSGVVGVAK